MAGFKTHITASTLVGIGYGGVAYYFYGVPWPACALAGGLCSVSGMLPDLDSGSSTPLRESVAFAAAVVPMMLMQRLEETGLSHELLLLAGAAIYLAVRFGLAEFLRRYTVHRGMFHSIPAALIFGELAFLLATGDDVRIRLYKAGAVTVGYLTHLVLDELWSIELAHGRLRFKQSFGTALKIYSRGFWSNFSAFTKLALLTTVIFIEPHGGPKSAPTVPHSVQEVATQVLDHIMKR